MFVGSVALGSDLHRDGHRVVHEPRDLDRVRVPVQLRHCAVVAHLVKALRFRLRV